MCVDANLSESFVSVCFFTALDASCLCVLVVTRLPHNQTVIY